MHENTLQWYNWIPTNLGILDYNFIARQQISSHFGKNIKFSKDTKGFRYWNLDLRNFQDSFPSYLTLSRGQETSAIGSIYFCILETKRLKGVVNIHYDNKFNISFEYDLEIHGKVCIFNPSFGLSNQIKNIDNALLNTFAQMAYMIIKQSLHGDSHHHQKIDYVLEVQRDVFPIDKIIYTFAKHIKNVERDIKSLDTCIGHLKAINAIEEVRGYISYANTFYALYEENTSSESKILVKNMHNVVMSLEATVAKKDNHFKYLDIAKTTSLAIFALILSLSLFVFKTFRENIEIINHNGEVQIIEVILTIPWYMLILLTLMLGLGIFYWLRRCYIKSYIFYKHYALYEQYKYISWIDLKNASFKYYFIKIMIPMGMILSSCYFIYMHFFNK